MNPSTLPELQDTSYADYVDAIWRESFLKSLQQAKMRVRLPRNRPGNHAIDADLLKKLEPSQSGAASLRE